MSKIQNPVIGRAKGSAGGMTFAKQFDKNTMRAKPFEVANPKTQGQTTQRDFFKQVQEIVASVSPEELRSLFGNMPKGMSRRNALSKQVSAAFSMEGNNKVVDFSKLQAIGNVSKIMTPIQEVTTDDGVFEFSMDGVELPSNPEETNPIVVIFDPNKNRILLFNTNRSMSDPVVNVTVGDLADHGDKTVYGYVTYEVNGKNVVDQNFGSFIIKTRATNANTNASGDTPKAGDVVTLSGSSIGSTATLNFANYDFNNLKPDNLYLKSGDTQIDMVTGSEWIEGENNEFSADLEENYDSSMPAFLDVFQGDEFVATIPFSVVVE